MKIESKTYRYFVDMGEAAKVIERQGWDCNYDLRSNPKNYAIVSRGLFDEECEGEELGRIHFGTIKLKKLGGDLEKFLDSVDL